VVSRADWVEESSIAVLKKKRGGGELMDWCQRSQGERGPRDFRRTPTLREVCSTEKAQGEHGGAQVTQNGLSCESA
jgi:hypothetical protein